VKSGSIIFELAADSELQRVLSLFRGINPANAKITTEVFTECSGKTVSQGKME
jgi:hypothetical protein